MAEYRRDVFCEWEFLKSFNDAQCTLMSEEATDLYFELRKFLKRSHLLLDKRFETCRAEIKTPTDPTFRLLKQATEGQLHIDWADKDGFEIKDNKKERLKVVVLSNNKGLCNLYQQKFGIVVLSPGCWKTEEEAKRHHYLFRDCGSCIIGESSYSWKDILRSEYQLAYCNTMVLIDNHILKNLKNLEELLDAILPPENTVYTREYVFYCTIITAKDINNSERNDWKNYSKLVKTIKKLRPDLEFKFDIYVEQQSSSNTFHDRYLLTNNVMITSGYGFGPLKVGKTSIHIWHPGIQNISDVCDDEYAAVLARIKKSVIESTSQGSWKHYPEGPCENRLIVEE